MFRFVNERVADARDGGNPFEVLCECGAADCVATVAVTVAEYEDVRRHPAHFIVLPGHAHPDVDEVQAEMAGFLVVNKTGDAAVYAHKTDPRADD